MDLFLLLQNIQKLNGFLQYRMKNRKNLKKKYDEKLVTNVVNEHYMLKNLQSEKEKVTSLGAVIIQNVIILNQLQPRAKSKMLSLENQKLQKANLQKLPVPGKLQPEKQNPHQHQKLPKKLLPRVKQLPKNHPIQKLINELKKVHNL